MDERCQDRSGAPDSCWEACAECVDEVEALVELVDGVGVVVLEALGAASAPAIPAAAPPAASAPVTIVAPSSLETVISSDLLRSFRFGLCRPSFVTHLRAVVAPSESFDGCE
jgi:hypothetical protein